MPTITEKLQLKQNIELRRIMSDAYAFVVGAQFNNSISALTLEDLIQQHIESIEGVDGVTSVRPNKLAQIDQIIESTTAAVEKAKNIAPQAFQIAADSRSRTSTTANTTEEGEA